MKPILTILGFYLTTALYSQRIEDIHYFYSVKNNNDSTLAYFMSFLHQFDSTDIFKNFFCETAAERVGDYYRSKQDYLRAIAYYDSADTKYLNKAQFCGNGYYIDFIPRRVKVAQCYAALQDRRKALMVLTPHIFDHFGSRYFDSTMTEFYIETLDSLYTKPEIINQLISSIANAVYTVHRSPKKPASKHMIVSISFRIRIFGSDLEFAGGDTYLESPYKIHFDLTKEGLTKRFSNLPIYRQLNYRSGCLPPEVL